MGRISPGAMPESFAPFGQTNPMDQNPMVIGAHFRLDSGPALNHLCRRTSTAERKRGTHFSLAADPSSLSKGVQGRWSQNFRWPVLVHPSGSFDSTWGGEF